MNISSMPLLMPFLRLALSVALLIALAGTVLGQTTVSSSTDTKTPAGLTAGSPAGSFALSGFDNINPYNGNLNFRLPLLSVGGRGSASHTITLALNTKKWHTRYSSNTVNGEIINETWTPTTAEWKGAEPGFGPGVLVGRQHGVNIWPSHLCNARPALYKYTLTRLYFITPDGSEHELRDVATNGQPQATTINQCSSTYGYNRGKVFASVDGEGMTFVSDNDILDSNKVISTGVRFFYPTGVLTLRDGTRYIFANGYMLIRDRNGNQVKYEANTITDSLGRQVTISQGITHPNYGYSDVISYKGSGGTQRDIVVSYDSLDHLMRNTQPTDVTTTQYYYDLFPGLNGSINVQNKFNPSTLLSSVWLPDGRRYRFYYNQYGELARVELPTGGAIEYDYTPTSASVREGSSYTGTDYQIYRRVVERRVYANGSTLEGKTKFPISAAGDWTGLVKHLDASDNLIAQEAPGYIVNDGVESMFYPASTNLYSSWQIGRPSSNTSLAVNGTVLRSSSSTWSQQAAVSWLSWWALQDRGAGYGGGDDPASNPRETDVVTTLADVSPYLVTKTHTDYDQYNNPTDVYEYDYGSGAAPTSYVRRTHTDYVTTNNGVNYATDNNIHLKSLPAQQQVYDASGTLRAQTSFEYDNYNQGATDVFHAGLTNRTNIVGLDSGYTTSYYTRGNVTKTTKYLLNSSGGVTDSISSWVQYDIAGNVVKTIDPRSTTSNIIATTIDYRDNFGAPTDSTVQSSGNPSNTAPAQLSGQSTFALPFSVTNALGHTAYTKYDYYLGQPVLAEDANNVKSSIYRDDALDRPTKGINAIGTSAATQTVFIYNDGLVPDNNGYPARSITTISDKDTFAESSAATPTGIKATALYDGLGRTWRTARYEGSNNWAIVETQFDALSRAYRSCNPFRAATITAALPSTPEWTTSTFDALSRVISVTTPDGAHVDTAYSGNRVLVSDQAKTANSTFQPGGQRISETDALGRLKTVWEVRSSDTGSGTESVSFPNHSEVVAGYKTTYDYDTLGNLIQVAQGSQRRWFAYDSLSRLIRARNPEQGTYSFTPSVSVTGLATGSTETNSAWSMAYSYDNNGNLSQRLDARGTTTGYAYDALNRVTNTGYSDGTPNIVRYYDAAPNGKGRPYLTVADSGSNNTQITHYGAYDPLGRLLNVKQYFQRGTGWGSHPNGTWGEAYITSRTYDLAGNVKTETYPSGHTVNYSYDTASRMNSFTGNLYDGTTRNYATGITYTPAGLMTKETFGTTTNLYHNLHYNNRQQLIDIRLGTSSTDEYTWNRAALIYFYSLAAASQGNQFLDSADNNGNLIAQRHYVPDNDAITGYKVPQNDIYYYDALNRLAKVEETPFSSSGVQPMSFSQRYTYDRYGNRTIDQTTWGANVNKANYTVDTATNRFTQLSYDAAGNVTLDGTQSRTYDAENRMKTSGVNSYKYDADGKRVVRVVLEGSVIKEYWQVYGIDGELVAEYVPFSAATAIYGEYGYRGGQLLITSSCSDGLHWLVTDHLGSTRLEVNYQGTVVKRHDNMPFGEELYAGIGDYDIRSQANGYLGADCVRQKFGSKERDAETGLDYFEARYFASVQGRFTGVDPYDINFERQNTPDEREANAVFANYAVQPQHWNHYTYALNNPLRYVDPDGLLEYEAELLGKKIKINISDKLSETDQQNIKKQIDAGIKIINDSADKLTDQQKSIIKNVNRINVRDDIARSYTIESTGTYNVVKSDLINSTGGYASTASWFASTIAHEGMHIELYKQSGGDVFKSRGPDAEVKSLKFQLEVAEHLGLPQYEMDYLRGLQGKPGERYKKPINKPTPRPTTRRPRRKP